VSGPLASARIARANAAIRELVGEVVTAATQRSSDITNVHPTHARSAANLLHYVGMRRRDLRDLQTDLTALGLSSLGRCEAHVLATLETVQSVLARLTDQEAPASHAEIGIDDGADLLRGRAEQLLGTPREGRSTRIMVTMPSEAASDLSLVGQLVAAGMDIARINCAHDRADDWRSMARLVREAAAQHGRTVLVAMDLAGPKLRTGQLVAGPEVIRVAPERSATGNVIGQARIRLYGRDVSTNDAVDATVLHVSNGPWLKRRHPGDRVVFEDARGARRLWSVDRLGPGWCDVLADQTAYVSTGTVLSCGDDQTRIVAVAAQESHHLVDRGDAVVLTRSLEPTVPTTRGLEHRIGCTLPEVFEVARVGQRVWFDDGKLGGVVSKHGPEEITVIIDSVRPGGVKLRAGKGINFPDLDFPIAALTGADLDALSVAAEIADIVNLSFVRRPTDVTSLFDELDKRDARRLGVVLKIETTEAFRQLPELLLTAMRHERIGVMIARGDLAVEVGYERMAEVQEEALWVCEAAHVPVIWATQVLDSLARTGRPSRAEVTDAAMSGRAECVMLNKGPHIVGAITSLDSILVRMQDHQHKKRTLLRRLRAWDHDA